jgi:hypothetical protein
MEGLKPGRIVYFVFDDQSAKEVMRRRTTGESIKQRMLNPTDEFSSGKPATWPAGAQAHIGNAVTAGQIQPAMVVAVNEQTADTASINLQVFLDGCDVYWATSVPYDATKTSPRSWHWMFDGQSTRYVPDRLDVKPTSGAGGA